MEGGANIMLGDFSFPFRESCTRVYVAGGRKRCTTEETSPFENPGERNIWYASRINGYGMVKNRGRGFNSRHRRGRLSFPMDRNRL
jgi:hypothetical protein